jgi:poly(A) polymerase
VPSELADWWEDFHLGNDEEREALLQDLRASAPGRSRRGGPARPAGAQPPSDTEGPAPGDLADEDEGASPGDGQGESDAPTAPRKRRRRRRRAGGGAAGAIGGPEGAPPAAG